MPLYTSTGAFNVAVNDTTGTGRYSASGALRINLVTGSSYVGLYAADGALNVVDVSGVAVSAYGGLYHPSGAIRGRTAPTTLSGLQAPDGSYYFLGLFSPLNLFANGEQGAWYDPSDFSTMFTDAAGTTPVTAVEQPVGLLLDKSKGLALGAELVTNGTFDTNTTGWTSWQTGTLSVDTSRLKIENGAATISGAYQLITVVVGRTYKFEGVKEPGTAAAPRYYLGTSIGGTQYATNATSGQVFLATSTTLVVTAATQSTVLGATAFFDNISVRELPGNHASQSTAASRPVLSARVNLLTYSEQFDNAAWGKFAGWAVGPTPATDPIGGLTADAIIPTAGTTLPYTLRSVTVPAVDITMSYYIKQGTSGQRWVQLGDTNHTNGRAWFDLTNGVPGTKQAGIATSSITPIGTQGWFLIKVTLTKANTSCEYFIQPASADNNAAETILWNGTDSAFFVWGADLRVTNVGVNLPAYQRVAAATDYDTSGFPLALKFDGVDDSLVTGTIDFSATDKMSVFAGVRKLSDVAAGFIAELTVTGSTAGAFSIGTSTTTGNASRLTYFMGQEAILSEVVGGAAVFTSPDTRVMTGLWDRSQSTREAEQVMRLNGSQQSLTYSSTNLATGNFASSPLYIGRRGGTSNSYNGNLYSLIVRGALSTDAQIASTETYVNSKTGAY